MADINAKITRKITAIKNRLTDSDVNNVIDRLIENGGILKLKDKINMHKKPLDKKVDLMLAFVSKAGAGQVFLDILEILEFYSLAEEIKNSPEHVTKKGSNTRPQACENHSHHHGRGATGQKKDARKQCLDQTSLEQIKESIQETNAESFKKWDEKHAEEKKDMQQMKAELMKCMREESQKMAVQMEARMEQSEKKHSEELKETIKEMHQNALDALREAEETRRKEDAKRVLELQKLNDTISELKEKMELKNKYADEYKNLEKKQKQLENEVSGKRHLKPKYVELKADTATAIVAKKQKSLQSEIDNLRKQKKGLEEKIEKLNRDKESMDAQLKQEKERVKALSKQLREQGKDDNYKSTYGDGNNSMPMYGMRKTNKK